MSLRLRRFLHLDHLRAAHLRRFQLNPSTG
jgi:hypothetical protein